MKCIYQFLLGIVLNIPWLFAFILWENYRFAGDDRMVFERYFGVFLFLIASIFTCLSIFILTDAVLRSFHGKRLSALFNYLSVIKGSLTPWILLAFVLNVPLIISWRTKENGYGHGFNDVFNFLFWIFSDFCTLASSFLLLLIIMEIVWRPDLLYKARNPHSP